MLLQNKIAIVYGAGGAIGGATALAFAKEGARVYLAGRTVSRLERTLQSITASGGIAEIVQVDAMNRTAVESLLESIVQHQGKLDISFNAIGYEDVQGKPLTEMEGEAFSIPVRNALQSHFVTATAAVRHMQKSKGGVVLAITANAGHTPYENVGSFGIACAAIEGFCRQLAAETGRYGIRVVCLRSSGSPDAPGVSEVFDLHAKNQGISRADFENEFAERTMLKRLPKLQEIANAAVMMASDSASAITAAVLNLTCGEIAD